jgi:hypothetical protein
MVYWLCAGMWCGFALYEASDGKWLKAALQLAIAAACAAGALS